MGFDFFSFNRKRLLNIAITTLLIVLAVAYFVWFSHTSDDPTPDSFAGYLFAIAGTVVLLLAAVRYSMHRRSRKRVVGLLSRSLNWHISFGILALVLIILHSFGNFNPRSGTYALFALVALVISGAIGRLIDRIAPGKIAQTASQALTEQGEDRIESITRGLQALVTHNRQQVQGVKLTHDAQDDATGHSLASSTPTSRTPATSSTARLHEQSLPAGWPAPRQKPEEAQILRSSWDMAYITIEETPQEIGRESTQYRFVPERKSALARPGALIPGLEEQASQLHMVEQALERERFYRYLIRYWRVFHVILALVTVALVAWHLEYAFSLLIPVILRR